MELDDPAYNQAMEGMEVDEEEPVDEGGMEIEEEEEDVPVTQEDAWAVIRYVLAALVEKLCALVVLTRSLLQCLL
jgi:hypothetical protein